MEILKRYEFHPDYTNIVAAARNQWAPRIPLYEHLIGDKVMFETTGTHPYDLMYSQNASESLQGFHDYWNFWRQMGYDTASMEFCVTDILPGNGALTGRADGCIKDRDDFEKYPWNDIPEMYFEHFQPVIENFIASCPEDMKAIGGVGNGVFESVQDIVGYMNLCYIKSDDEELFRDIFKKMGQVHFEIWKKFLEKYSDVYCVHRFGDDLGFKTMTLLSTDDIRENILPQYRRIIDMVHAKGKPFLLHSCGCLFSVFDDIINMAQIDAKHSNEDVIAHFSVWVDRYGDRIGNFGGVDTDILCRFSEQEIREYVLDSLERVKMHGGIAFGSGNSIPDYVPTEGYLAMIDTVRKWRQDHQL